MKKLIFPIMGISVIGSAASSVVSCTTAGFAAGNIGQRVMVITDAGKINDKSFNQSAWESMNEFTGEAYGIDSSKNYVEPINASSAGLLAGYKLGIYKDANTLVLAGFAHAAAIDRISNLLGPNKTIVLADSVAPATKNNNVISLTYNSELAGFASGFDAAIWATQINQKTNKLNGDANGDGKISFGTFAGISSKGSVDNYNWGFLVAAQTYNLLKQDDREPIYFANAYNVNNRYATVDDIGTVKPSDTNWFSNSFELGGATASGITGSMYSKKADIVFAVAGPEIQDVLSYSSRTYNPYVIGVDVDQAASFAGYEGQFLSSSTKNLKGSIKEALQHTRGLKKASIKNADGTYIEGDYNDNDLWDGQVKIGKPSWSYNAVGGKYNILQKTAIDFKNSKHEDLGARINELFLATGPALADYWNSKIISETAQTLVDENLLKDISLDINLASN